MSMSSRLAGRVLLLLLLACAGALRAQPAPTRVVVLGVTHSGQLVDAAQRPGAIRALMARIHPDAVAVERDPQSFARNDFYEFTFEAQSIAVPWARELGLPVYPIDWLPPVEDQRLLFGIDVETPPLIRAPDGLGAFMAFADPTELRQPLFYADGAEAGKADLAWADTVADPAIADGARRLYLYRTFQQARRVMRAAANHRGGVLLVVVGSQHKPDLERVLAGYPQVQLVPPQTFGEPPAAEAQALETDADAHAVSVFNLLGVQSGTGNIDFDYVAQMLARLERSAPGPESALLRARFEVLAGRLRPTEALAAYRAVAESAGGTRFAWTGVKDRARVDSYFDPFGNLTVKQRAMLEQARELGKLGRGAEADALRDRLAAELGGVQAAQLLAYWPAYVRQMR
jgi:hypothetical protein